MLQDGQSSEIVGVEVVLVYIGRDVANEIWVRIIKAKGSHNKTLGGF